MTFFLAFFNNFDILHVRKMSEPEPLQELDICSNLNI